MLLIQDNRPGLDGQPRKINHPLRLRVLDRPGCHKGEWRTHTRELLIKLQKSSSALRGKCSIVVQIISINRRGSSGFVKLSYENCLFPNYRQTLLTMQPGRPLEEAELEAGSEFVVIGLSCILQLIVDHVSSFDPWNLSGKSILQVDPSDVPPQSGLLFETELPSTAVNARHPNPTPTTIRNRIYKAEVEWLRDLASQRPGYHDFRAGRNRVLCNGEIAKNWIFAVQFCGEYNKGVFSTVT